MTRLARVLVLLVLASPLSATPMLADPCGGPDATRLSAGGAEAALILPEDGIAVGRGFSMQIAVCSPGWRAKDVTARMPAHGHGMNYRPTLHETRSAIRADGMLFHMPGLWKVSVHLSNGPESRDATVDLTVAP